ncbi:MAG TPA: hypothetical protein VHB48_16515 [Chitinophagaceae bacterium]|nr:hypothetical protein [Chitinophagaceae bacterium]
MKARLTFAIAIFLFFGCINQKYLSKHQLVFKVESTGDGKAQVVAYNSGINKLPVSFKDSGEVLLVQPKDQATRQKFILPTIVETQFKPGAKYFSLAGKSAFYFPETQFPADGDSNSNHAFVTPPRLHYIVNNIVLQAATTPLKVRPPLTAPKRLKDSLGLQALAELNIGVALGFKKTWGSYIAKSFSNGQKVRNFSISGSGFISFGGTTVKPITIRYYRPFEKTEPALSGGGCILFGFNNINIGFSAGADRLIDRNIGKRWIYDGNIWYGITLAYDILK